MAAAADREKVAGASAPPCPMPKIGFSTHIGLGVRPANEDTGWVASEPPAWDNRGRVLAMADGMGGHKGGGRASLYACKAIARYYQRLPCGCGHSIAAELSRRGVRSSIPSRPCYLFRKKHINPNETAHDARLSR